MAKLQILNGKRKGAIFDLPNAVDIDIGNRKSAKLSIRDPWISYNHAKISKQGTGYVIEDLGSSNGTWINGEKITRHELTTNSVLIYFGKTKVRFTSEDGGDAAAAPAAKGEDSPWWDKVLGDDDTTKGNSDPARVRRLETELREERRMREALEKFLSLPKGATVGDVARAGELERELQELRARPAASGGGGGASEAQVKEAVEAEREKLRREHMSKTVELEGKVAQSESKTVDLERRLKDKTEQAKKDVAKAREKVQAEIDELKASLEQEREGAKNLASGGDGALAAERERGDKLAAEADALKEKLRAAEERADGLEASLKEAQDAAPSSETTEQLETIKSQLWASIQEAAKWKDEAAQLGEEIEAAQADAEKWKEEHAAIVQEIDEISMEQIDVEDELNNRIRELEDKLGIPHEETGDDGDEPKDD